MEQATKMIFVETTNGIKFKESMENWLHSQGLDIPVQLGAVVKDGDVSSAVSFFLAGTRKEIISLASELKKQIDRSFNVLLSGTDGIPIFYFSAETVGNLQALTEDWLILAESIRRQFGFYPEAAFSEAASAKGRNNILISGFLEDRVVPKQAWEGAVMYIAKELGICNVKTDFVSRLQV